jgi:hypothetical protein
LQLHEKVIPTGNNFFEQGGRMNVEVGAGDDLRTLTLNFGYEAVVSPPLHPDCRCVLLPFSPRLGDVLPSVGPEQDLLRFESGLEADEWALSTPGITPALSSGELTAMDDYKFDGFFSLNKDLRELGTSDSDLVPLLDSAIAKTRVPSPLVVYRGTRRDHFNSLDDLTGSVIGDLGFVSTSMDQAKAQAWVGAVAMEIRLPVGGQALYMDRKRYGSASESEILLPRNSVFSVASDKQIGNQRKVVLDWIGVRRDAAEPLGREEERSVTEVIDQESDLVPGLPLSEDQRSHIAQLLGLMKKNMGKRIGQSKQEIEQEQKFIWEAGDIIIVGVKTHAQRTSRPMPSSH